VCFGLVFVFGVFFGVCLLVGCFGFVGWFVVGCGCFVVAGGVGCFWLLEMFLVWLCDSLFEPGWRSGYRAGLEIQAAQVGPVL
jgi:hypothetical protein